MRRSTDNGATWAAFNSGLTNLNVTSIAVGPQPGPPCRISCGTAGSGLFDLDESAASFLPGWVPSAFVPSDAVVKEVRQAFDRYIAEEIAVVNGDSCMEPRDRGATLADLQTLRRLYGNPRAIAGGESVVLVGTNGSGILRQTSGATDVAEVQSLARGPDHPKRPQPVHRANADPLCDRA